MTRRAAIAALALAALFAAVGARDAHAEWVTEVVTNRVEYDGVEYLSSTGNKEKITYFRAIYGYERIELKGKANVVPSSNGYFYGYNAPWTGVYRNGFGNFACQYGSTNPNYNMGVAFNTSEHIIIQDNSVGSVYVSGVETVNYTAISTSSSSRGMSLFVLNGGSEYLNCRIYYFKHSVSGKLIANLVPILHNGVGKMIDMTRGELLSNVGTGAFAYGSITGKVAYVSITTNRVYRAPAPMRSFDAAHPFNSPTARTRLGGTGSGEDGTTLRPTAHFDIKKNEED